MIRICCAVHVLWRGKRDIRIVLKSAVEVNCTQDVSVRNLVAERGKHPNLRRGGKLVAASCDQSVEIQRIYPIPRNSEVELVEVRNGGFLHSQEFSKKATSLIL